MKWWRTDFLGLGVDREEAGMLDFFLKNILNVAESKFSTAKHLHDVWRGMKIAIYGWTGLISCRARKKVRVTWKDGLNNNTGAQRQFTPQAVLWFCFQYYFFFGQIPEWDRQLQGSVCWSAFVFASAAPSGRSLNLRFPVNNSTAELLLINSVLTTHLQAAAWFKRRK